MRPCSVLITTEVEATGWVINVESDGGNSSPASCVVEAEATKLGIVVNDAEVGGVDEIGVMQLDAAVKTGEADGAASKTSADSAGVTTDCPVADNTDECPSDDCSAGFMSLTISASCFLRLVAFVCEVSLGFGFGLVVDTFGGGLGMSNKVGTAFQMSPSSFRKPSVFEMIRTQTAVVGQVFS